MRGMSVVERREVRAGCATASRGRGLAAHRVEVDLSPRATEQVAARVAQLLAERQGAETEEMISAGELALRLRVERPWVYRNRRLLGGIRLGTGPKAPWRFDYRAAIEAMREPRAGGPDGGGR